MQAFFDHADTQVGDVRNQGRKGWLPAFRDAALFKIAYAFGLRRTETVMLDLADFGTNPHAAEFGQFGLCRVRFGKAAKGSAPKRRTVLTVWDWVPGILEQWIAEARRAMAEAGRSPALWPSERGLRVGGNMLNKRFAAYRDAVLDPFAGLLLRQGGPHPQHLAVPRPQPRPASRLRHHVQPAPRPRVPHAHRTDLRTPRTRRPGPRPRHRRRSRLFLLVLAAAPAGR